MSEEEIKKKIQEMETRELMLLEGKKNAVERVYTQYVPYAVKRLADLTCISQENILRYAIATEFHFQDIPTHKILDILLAFFLARDRDENPG